MMEKQKRKREFAPNVYFDLASCNFSLLTSIPSPAVIGELAFRPSL
jgi:hypothetical protein